MVVVFAATLALAGAAAGCATTERDPAGFVVIGAASLPKFEGADEAMEVPFIVSRVTRGGQELEIEGLQGRLDLWPASGLRAGPAVSVSLPRVEASSEVVAQLEERDLAIEAGGFIGFRTPLSMLREGQLTGTLSARQDVSGVHDGTLVTAELEAFFAASYMLRFGAGLSATVASTDYMRTYYSTAAGNEASLDAFDAGAGIKELSLEVYSILSFSETLGVFSRVAYTQLMGDARRSPVVVDGGSDEQFFFGAGLFWRF